MHNATGVALHHLGNLRVRVQALFDASVNSGGCWLPVSGALSRVISEIDAEITAVVANEALTSTLGKDPA